MSKFEEMYKQKLKTADEIAGYIQNGFVCAAPSATSEPRDICNAIGERARRNEIEGVQHHSIITPQGDVAFLDPELSGKYTYVSWFTTGPARSIIQSGKADYMPCNYSYIPDMWREDMPRVDVFYAVVSPMDKHGYFSFGLTASENLAQMSRAKYIFLEVNESMPRVFGTHIVHISQATAICESHYDMPTLASAPISENDVKMGQMMADLIPNGATLQFGIGGVPNAVGACLKDKTDLGIHTEMFTDSMIDLIECGAVTNGKKPINQGKTVAAFAWGSRRMYDFLDDNVSIEMRPVDYVNNPTVIGQHDNFISINSCLEIDLLGQVCAESIGTKNFSGTGGQLDFVRGCKISKGGKSFIATGATAKKGTMSKIKPVLTPGAAVTTGKNDVDYIVTEFGMVRLRGLTAGQRAKALISIAHPDFREELTFEAKKMNLMI